jgi:hypothetical protein
VREEQSSQRARKRRERGGCPANENSGTPTGDEPIATGSATLARIRLWRSVVDFDATYCYTCHLTVACQGLTPGATQATSAGTVKAAQDGTLVATTSKWSFVYIYHSYWPTPGGFWSYPALQVSRINADGSQTLVLYTALPYPP